MSTRVEVTCDRCGAVWIAKLVSSRFTCEGLKNLCKKCDKEFLILGKAHRQDMISFLKGEKIECITKTAPVATVQE